ncbi:gamma-irradiation and mitomycin c induced 1 [Arabidopsis thaliana]|uniref:Gamma-irradiation and mitomycin c induced 1 n=1 Tax=Arabidopsis thaliana TaxID=3702 RepID=A0A1P8BA87_ARATH|nr:gamma-irradiation and mitomycin c induced 1 [Arabidopsis thaliana]NP_001330246.1 gamma-irradiation and mitomycin c induced 1 [Arabidopsis thaliana]ANM68491.1 gamma-irradiation and mitomycin c induced 1 [Arabidopsis thaliana]ANM68492.1 gamma-irradiation and mitomycin c induced 1 [Arabidopsis thaliana]|eukprot:NP_001330245.1 gamma-irradiation and mitomycin c induced 1 [Arabidopsis thaliana]
MSSRRSVKRSLVLDDDDDEDIFYNFKVLLPNGTSVKLTLKNPEPEISMQSFVNLVKKEYDNARKDCLLMSKRMKVDWNSGGKFHLESNGGKMKGIVRFAAFKPDLCHIIRLDDGSGIASTMYENLWDLTPDTDLLKELPENYSFETALADLIDNSLQAVWPYREGARKLISVDISGDHITVFDTGRGMDSSEGNSIDKWGKIGASLHRSQKTGAIGGNPPYLKPYFGMFGYGGPYASMFLGRRTLVSSKTKESKKVFTLQFKKEALIDNRSIVGKNWKTDGGMRDPSEEEMKLSPHGSFTKVEIFESEFDISKIYQLQCRLKDIYFPYIQCDELSKTGRTERPVAFQVNGEDLAEIAGGEVAITNLHSKGQFFSFQIRFTLFGGKRKGTAQEANARLKFVYFPIVQGKESIEKILQSLEEEGCKVSESFQTFGRVSLRRLGRLLPEVRWDSIPFMQRGNRASTLQKSCRRVKCFVDLDAGFSPTPSKTDLASQNPFSVALRNFGSKSTEKEKDDDVNIVIHREGKSVSYAHLEEKYQEWVLEMHNTHDEEAASGLDEAVLIVGSLDKKALGILRDAVRVHKEVRRKEKTWKRGQNIKILRGAYAGIHNNNVYATIDYFLIEGFEDEAGGDTRILCRPIDRPENEGCKLSIIDGISKLEVQSSLSLPITIIDSGKCLPVDANEWNRKLDKQQEKAPSKIDLLDERDCRELKIDGELPIGNSVRAGKAPPKQIVAVVRPACFTSLTPSKKLDQKNIVKMDGEEMVMVVKLKSSDKNISSQRLFPTSRKGISGLYIFSLGSKFPNLFKKAGTYNFSFSIGNSIKCNKTVVVRPSSKAARWELDDNLESLPCNVRVGSSLPPFRIACFDKYKNKIPFTSVPSLEVELEASPGFLIKIDKLETNLINDGLILKIENMLVETDELDQIRPNYEATLEIRAMDNPFSVSVPCKVNPGPLKRVAVNNPKALENLLPDSTVEDFILELFDGYNNHVAEGTDVLIHIDGYRIEDWMGINRKVDSRGCINLSGILKVTEGYGKSVSLSVMSGNEVIFCKESQIDERQLRLVTELPDCCTAGTNLMNLIFQVTELDGSLDTSIHHDEKSGCFHTMSIESDSSSVESAIRYAFVHGSCKVSSLSLPENEGVFSCRVFHSRYPELQMSIKIQVTSAPTSEREESGYSTPHSKTTPPPESGIPSITNPWPTPCSQFGVLAIRSSSLALSSETSLMDMAQYTEDLKEKINIDEERRVELEERLKCLQAQREHAEQECSRLQASLEPLGAPFPECLSTKESMMKQIEEKHHDTAASVFCCLYRKAPPPRSLFLSQKGMFGVVALLGSVASTSLSRVLSEYLGKDTMLSLVCKSSQFGPKSDEYRKFQSEAASLGRSITNRFLVICLDATRPWRNGLVRNDPQKRLAMDNPYLPNGDPIPGFKGYAVNMIDLASEELDIQSSSGYGLRETLFYGVFRELQVYETAEHLEAALPHINGGDAVSLDGVIARENGFIYSGCCTPEVHFPITVTERQEKALVQLEITRDKKRKTEEMMTEENRSLRRLVKKLKKANEKYQNFTAMADS